ncbi:MAG: radical SAM protein, partial [Acidobacteria bacterium]|nr:radical SAM protein [Acidobacteriota bacterium]
MRCSRLVDGHGRVIGDLRVSVTDRCNFRCQYCMSAKGLPWLQRAEVLTFEEIERVVRLVSSMGVRAVRLTGGEPLVRREFPRLASMLAPPVDDLAVTTNGFLLERDAAALVEAGITRFNVSIDSLQRDRFFEMARRDALDRVLRGLEILAQFPEAHPDQDQRRREARVHRAGDPAVRRVRTHASVRGALHRVHAARRRRRLAKRPRHPRRRDSGPLDRRHW